MLYWRNGLGFFWLLLPPEGNWPIKSCTDTPIGSFINYTALLRKENCEM